MDDVLERYHERKRRLTERFDALLELHRALYERRRDVVLATEGREPEREETLRGLREQNESLMGEIRTVRAELFGDMPARAELALTQTVESAEAVIAAPVTGEE